MTCRVCCTMQALWQQTCQLCGSRRVLLLLQHASRSVWPAWAAALLGMLMLHTLGMMGALCAATEGLYCVVCRWR